MLVRQILISEGDSLRTLRVAALIDAPYAFGARLEDVLREPPEKFESDAIRHSTSDMATSLLAFSGEAPIGIIGAFFEQPSQRPFICSLWVRESFRGGAAAGALLHGAVEWLAERGAKSCYAWVSDNNDRAISFYKKNGFTNTGLSQPLPSDQDVNEHLYLLELRNS